MRNSLLSLIFKNRNYSFFNASFCFKTKECIKKTKTLPNLRLWKVLWFLKFGNLFTRRIAYTELSRTRFTAAVLPRCCYSHHDSRARDRNGPVRCHMPGTALPEGWNVLAARARSPARLKHKESHTRGASLQGEPHLSPRCTREPPSGGDRTMS